MSTHKNLLLDSIIFYISIIFPVIFYLFLTWTFVDNFDRFDSYTDGIMMFLKLFWFGGIILVPSSFIAFAKYGSPLRVDQENIHAFRREGWNPELMLNVVYVSKGFNVDSLIRSTTETLDLLESHGVNYHLEIVTDFMVHEFFDDERFNSNRVTFVQVPQEYKTEKLALYKARALHFALETRSIGFPKEQLFNLHLDEESQITPEVIAGIHKFLKHEENHLSVGQGEIKYNAYNYGRHKLITAIDSIRTGDDLGRFRFQLKYLNKPLFGLHGSFLFIPQVIEERVGFDLGGRGSITEDAYFALIAANEGIKFDWIEGFIREQSPFTLGDILKQRRRWISGLEMLADDPLLELRTRLPLKINLLLWEIAWISILVTILNVIIGGSYFPIWLQYGAGILTGGYISLYTLGVYRNLMDLDMSIIKKIGYYFLVFLLVPLAAAIEAIAVIYSLVNPMKTFEVVSK